jgi:hypothetical protein
MRRRSAPRTRRRRARSNLRRVAGKGRVTCDPPPPSVAGEAGTTATSARAQRRDVSDDGEKPSTAALLGAAHARCARARGHPHATVVVAVGCRCRCRCRYRCRRRCRPPPIAPTVRPPSSTAKAVGGEREKGGGVRAYALPSSPPSPATAKRARRWRRCERDVRDDDDGGARRDVAERGGADKRRASDAAEHL